MIKLGHIFSIDADDVSDAMKMACQDIDCDVTFHCSNFILCFDKDEYETGDTEEGIRDNLFIKWLFSKTDFSWDKDGNGYVAIWGS